MLQNELVKCVRHSDIAGVARLLPMKETDVNAMCPVTVRDVIVGGAPEPYLPHLGEVRHAQILPCDTGLVCGAARVA